MSLSAPNFLVAVVAPLFATDPGGLDRLGVGDARARQRVPAQAGPQSLAQHGVQPLPCPLRAPPAEPPVDGLPRRKILGQQPPGAAALEDVEDGVKDLAGAVGSRSSPF